MDKLTTASTSANDFRPFKNQRAGNPVEYYTKLEDKVKLAAYGTDLLRDEKGDYFLLTYAQASPLSEKARHIDTAYRKAETAAKGLLRQFLGMQVKVETDQQTGESINSFDDGSELYFNIRFGICQSRQEKIRIQGIETIDEWELVHPWVEKPLLE